ncbi:MAG: hypothetical protein A9Z00_01960 [Thermobacillus sp. ZCTH02-B1]|uniref:TM2 domain-containing protein n=1 Tax=Thermobacillus sp. ZCTH02-B1 TaxID=1858795 RepID=UPI000B557D65|nr:TM2 domain-containing protein [Thermobacillus sp. ZCTH02-B1]OUM97216.1 MAG: hypothetical protein A9Z00_01960 [Thermobacillus sp. ZCTH02-B1]
MDLIAMKSRLDARQLMIVESEIKNQGKNMIVAYVLWYFLGFLGGHRFYMKRTGSAIAQLILSITIIGIFVTFIWWVVDAFLLHNWVKEHNRELEYRLVSQMIAEQGPPAPHTF